MRTLYAKISLQKISLLKLSELKRHGCPDTLLYALLQQKSLEQKSHSIYLGNRMHLKQT